MQLYELLYIIKSSLSDEEVQQVVGEVNAELEKNGAHIITQDLVGRRRLAYPIKQEGYGYYVVIEYSFRENTIYDMNKSLKLNDRIIRHLTTKKEMKSEAQQEKEKQLQAKIQETRMHRREEELVKTRDQSKLVQRKEELVLKEDKASTQELEEKLDEILKRDIV